MKRILEHQLVDDKKSVKVLADSFDKREADFFLMKLEECFPNNDYRDILDLCCGTGDFAIFLAGKKSVNIDAVDGSPLVLEIAEENIVKENLENKIIIKNLHVPFLIDKKYDLIYSLSSLHHFHNPQDFWITIKNHSKEKTKVLVIDTHRPLNEKIAKDIVEHYEHGESTDHQKEAYDSLLASFEIKEVVNQLNELDLDLNVEEIKTKFDGFSTFVVWGEL
jgi:ubiquinone/menaquinone biosynthesis C-methylase UbiE